MPDYHRIGTLRLSGLDDIAARAAKRIIAAKFPARYALTCDPDGDAPCSGGALDAAIDAAREAKP